VSDFETVAANPAAIPEFFRRNISLISKKRALVQPRHRQAKIEWGFGTKKKNARWRIEHPPGLEP
jgi:hypothetical protein